MIGKRLSKGTAAPGDLEEDGFHDVDMQDIDESYGNDDDDDVQWVGGHETLSQKKKRAGSEDDSDGSDEEEVRWQTPNDSADIDIEVQSVSLYFKLQ